MMDVAIVGASGYAGIELTRILAGHPDFRLAMVTSHAEAGRLVSEVYPKLTTLTDLRYEAPEISLLARRAQVVFLAVPHSVSMGIVPELYKAGAVIIDASADYRLKDPNSYERWYGTAHSSPELLSYAVYGLPEVDRSSLPGAQLVACPGCYPTATALAAAPALQAGIVSGNRVIVDAKSGVSGAGKEATAITHFPAINETVAAYKVGSHRHIPEMEQQLSMLAQRKMQVAFTPHLIPMTRGLLSTVYMELSEPMTTEEVFVMYEDRYREEPFITICEPGQMPSTGEVSGTNRAHIGVTCDPSGVLIATCAIDNLIKGTSGQAVQCANIALGIEETTGLKMLAPVI